MPAEPQASVRPTAAQLEWADCEIGVIIHLDVQVFEPSYQFRKQWGYSPAPAVFNPAELDTDQWIEAAAQAGATYAVLVAKHCSGFSLWPTKAHEYSVAASPWRNGKGNIVGDFFASCARRGIRPGLYYSSSCNAFLDVDNPGTVRSGGTPAQEHYNQVVIKQLTELWTEYGPVFEIWFDGGTLPPEAGGPDIATLLHRLQPEAVVFQGPPACNSLLRWVGNERGDAPYPCWSRTHQLTASDGVDERLAFGIGNPDGSFWAPAESDMPNRDQRKAFMGGWFWREGEDGHLYATEHLMTCYGRTVGHNSNLLLGMVIDNRGRVPEGDCAQFREFGSAVRRRFANCLGKTAGAGQRLTLTMPQAPRIRELVLMEDITGGQLVREYRVLADTPSGQKVIATGTSIGHKRIQPVEPVDARALTLEVITATGDPVIRCLAAY